MIFISSSELEAGPEPRFYSPGLVFSPFFPCLDLTLWIYVESSIMSICPLSDLSHRGAGWGMVRSQDFTVFLSITKIVTARGVRIAKTISTANNSFIPSMNMILHEFK